MGAFDQSGVQRDHVHEHAEAEFLLQQPADNVQLWESDFRIDKQLHRIVAGFAMDIDSAREVRGLGIVLPVVVGEPTILGGNSDQIPGAFMGNAAFGFGFAIQD